MLQAVRMFPHDATAEQWFIRVRWPQGPHCPHCGAGSHRVQSGAKHETMPFRRRDCRKHFAVRSGTVMHAAIQPGLPSEGYGHLSVYDQPQASVGTCPTRCTSN